MKVHELIARLARADPEDIVGFDPAPQCLRIFDTRLGLFQLDEMELVGLTEQDKEFLRAINVQL